MINLGPLYHWSPRTRLNSIKRLGLVPGRRNISGAVHHADEWIPSPGFEDEEPPPRGEFRQPAVCTSPSPATAWAYSHAVWKIPGIYDLWEFTLIDSDDVEVLRMWGANINEIRVHNRVLKSRLTWVGERTL